MADYVVNTLAEDSTDDDVLSLREAIALANEDGEVSTITFDQSLLDDPANSELIAGLIRLTEGELELTSDITINGDVDGDGKADITITGDANGDDLLLEGTNFSDAINNSDFDDDNSRVFHVTDGIANLDSLNITGGNGGSGGGISIAVDATLNLDKSTLAGNLAQTSGGAIFSDGTMKVTNSTFFNNLANNGGAVYCDRNSEGLIFNTTIFNNKARDDGGGICVNLADLVVSHNTIVGNEAADKGGGIRRYYSDLNVANSIVLGNEASTNVEYSDHSNGYTPGNTNILTGNLEDIFAELDENGVPVLADNGGPVLTLALKDDPNNPALDAVTSTLETDARGNYRDADVPGTEPDDIGTSDVGAFELTGSSTDGDDVIYGTSEADDIDTGDGNDVVYSAGSADTIDGGDGYDEVVFAGEMS